MRSPRTRATLATTLLALSACGGKPAAPPTAKHAMPPDAAAPVVVADAGDPLPSFDALAARGASDTPLMREAERVADASTRHALRFDRDGCVRVLFAASRPVRAWIADDTKAPRGDVAPASTSSLVPPKGPACARKGEVLELVLEAGSEPLSARAVVWMSP